MLLRTGQRQYGCVPSIPPSFQTHHHRTTHLAVKPTASATRIATSSAAADASTVASIVGAAGAANSAVIR